MKTRTNLAYALAAIFLATAVLGFAAPAFAEAATGQLVRVRFAETGAMFTGVLSAWTDEGAIISLDSNE